ncbi:hypothetical protein B0H34DRAFT_665164 [Crassisporium funariophilum]|nr:hypothetical protein B0H34DRAFT_665164 [Crassisporium funariophilum]
MPPPKGPIWSHFLPGVKQNGSHLCAHCGSCIEKERPMGAALDLDNDGNPKLSGESWVIDGKSIDISLTSGFLNLHLLAMKAGVGGVLGVKESMITHILGKAKKVKDSKDLGKQEREDSESDNDNSGSTKKPKRKMLTKVETSLKQSQLKVFRGIAVPFTDEQQKFVCAQFLRTTISANLVLQWVDDPEVIKLFYFFCATAGNVIPSRPQISGQLLDNANQSVTQQLKAALQGKDTALEKDESKNLLNGVNILVEEKVNISDYLILATAHKKEGLSICLAFEGMIEKAENIYGVIITAFCCDNNGGSQHRRKDLVLKWLWLFGPPCCAHQFQLILGRYSLVNLEAAETAEQETDLNGWILNHGQVPSIFNKSQEETSAPPRKVLAFLVAKMTRWTAHLTAFACLCDLKTALQRAVISQRHNIIDAQVGAEKNRQKRQKFEDKAAVHCDLIDTGIVWRNFVLVVNDHEPIFYGLNMNQTNAMHPDQVLLSFAGIFLYFQKHSKTL